VKITKFVHSCLLVETPDRVALIDPGQYSWDSGLLDLDRIDRIDRILITHEHEDHCSIDFIKAVLVKFPQAHIITNQSVESHLKNSGIEVTYRRDSDCAEPFEAPHERMVDSLPPENNGFHFKDQLTDPGDSHHFSETKEILALPITAPWGSMSAAIKLAIELKPKHVIPIHDWHWNEQAREWSYERAKDFLGAHDINFISPTDGVSFEL
jgi:L-ascorbate metabolism protein UlaG (beta-lactamase superfamily)